jgi:hypothetical protein
MTDTKAGARRAAAEVLPFHPIASLFPLMQGEQLDELVKDVRANGLIHPIIKLDGQILDGRNRYRACLRGGVEPVFGTFPGGDPVAFVISANIHRRHLTLKQKRELIAKLLKARPERSNLATAKLAKSDDKTVASVRREMEGRSEIPNVETRTDTKGRQQPAHKSPELLPERDDVRPNESEPPLHPVPEEPGVEPPAETRRRMPDENRPEECIMRWLENYVLLFQYLRERLQTDSSYHAEVNELAAYCFKERGEVEPPTAEEVREVARWLEAFAAALEEYEILKAAS